MKGKVVAKIPTSAMVTVSGVSTEVTFTMVANTLYQFTTNTACFIKQGAAGATTATAGSGSILVPANTSVFLHGSSGAALAVIQDTTGGRATLCEIQEI